MFFGDQRGTIAISTAVGGIVVIAAMGAVFDGAQIFTAHQSLQNVADTTALAALQSEDMGERERIAVIREVIGEYVEANGDRRDIAIADIKIDGAKEVAVTLSDPVDLVFGHAVGLGTFDVKARAVSKAFDEVPGDEEAHVLTSVSFVIDLSESMGNDWAGSMTKLNAVKSAVTTAFANVGNETQTGLYPFDWGLEAPRVVPLQPGANETLTSLSYSAPAEGSVASLAMESALADQQADAAINPGATRYVVYVADGGVDAEKGDVQGDMLTDAEIFPAGVDASCMGGHGQVVSAQNKLAKEVEQALAVQGVAQLESWPGVDDYTEEALKHTGGDMGESMARRRILREMSAELLMRDGNVPPETLHAAMSEATERNALGGGLDNISENMADELNIGIATDDDELGNRLEDVSEDFADLVIEEQALLARCEPMQRKRVLDACEAFRADGIAVLALDMAMPGTDGSELSKQCVFGRPDAPTVGKPQFDRRRGPAPAPDLANGMPDAFEPGVPYTSEDGSIYVYVDTPEAMRRALVTLTDVTMTPAETSAERVVRLVR